MTFFTKFPRTKLFTVTASFLATAIVWSTLAWPDWTAAKASKAIVPDPQIAALHALAALPPQQLAALTAPPPAPAAPAPRQIVRQTIVIKRTVGSPAYIVSDGGAPAGDPQYAVAAPGAAPTGDATTGDAIPSLPRPAGAAPQSGAPAPRPAGAPAPAPAPVPAAPSDATVPAAPPPPMPPPPSAPAPAPTTPPPPPAPTAQPAPVGQMARTNTF